MTRTQQQDEDPRYKDWRHAYREDVVERVKHWGVSRGASVRNSKPRLLRTLDASVKVLTA